MVRDLKRKYFYNYENSLDPDSTQKNICMKPSDSLSFDVQQICCPQKLT